MFLGISSGHSELLSRRWIALGGQEIAVTSATSKDSVEERNQLGAGLYANGILFGLQPDALFVIVPALTLPTQLAATAYISMFVVGTVAAMGSYTAVIGARRARRIFKYVALTKCIYCLIIVMQSFVAPLCNHFSDINRLAHVLQVLHRKLLRKETRN